MKWTAAVFLLVLAGALTVPSEFAAMGAAPGQGMETARAEERDAGTQTPEREERRAPQEQAQQAQARPDQALPAEEPARETEEAPRDQDRPVQSPAQPVWRQGEQAADQDRPERTQAPTPVWRQGAASGSEAPAVARGAVGGPIRLFQSAAFRGNFNALPKWKRVLSKVRGEIQTLNTCASPSACPPGAASWQRILKQARGKERMEQLRMVNSFFNKWPYRLDQDAYGVSDWWATPREFLKISGDCEDYAIIKYFALRELGFPPDDLRIVVVRDRIRGIAHAVLAVFTHGDAYILNNVSDAIFTHDKYRHYIPQYSLNEEHRWSHIPVANKP